MNAWLLTNTPSPYQVDLLSAIERSGRCRLSVRFMRSVHRGATWQPAVPPFEFRVLRGLGPRVWADAFRIHPEALREVTSPSFDCCVLSGQYTSLTFVACAFRLVLRRRPWAMWLERPWPDEYRPGWSRNVSARSGLGRFVRRRIMGWLARRAPRILCIGTAAQAAYARAGAPQERLVNLPYHCNVDRFRQVDPARIAAVRGQYGLDGQFVYLYSGQIIRRKGVDVLLAAFQNVARNRPDISLVILGDGPERPVLEQQVDAALRGRIHFSGQLDQSDLPAYMKAADVFVFPSRYDGWGVVINEACAAGLPVITTDGVAAAADLVEEGGNGFVVRRDDPGALAEKMEYFAANRDRARAFGQRSLDIINRFTPQIGAAIFCDTMAALAVEYRGS